MTKFFLALVLAVSALTVSGAGSAASSANASSAPAPPCRFDRLPDDVDTSNNANGVPRYLAWSQTPVNQRVLDSVHRALAVEFGSPDAAKGLRQLQNGLIGLVLDHREQRFVIVLSRHLKLAEYQERISRLVPETQERGAAPVVVQHGCVAAAALERSMRVLGRGKVFGDRFGARLDAATSQVEVTIPLAETAPRALSALPGVKVTHGKVRSRKGRRKADRSPHWGAASIRKPNGVTCTSWATVKRPNGRRMGVTAGHCGRNGSKWRSGRFFYGTAKGRRNFPEQDSMRLHGRRSHVWGARFYGNAPYNRVVVGDNNPRVGDMVCKSGQTTGVVCGIEVIANHYTARYAGGVNHNLVFAEKPCSLTCPTVGQGGDSGGPVFESMANKRAGIRGMEVAGTARNNLIAEKARVIRRHLDVKVLRRR